MTMMAMGELFALAAALCYGTTHFFNGLLARRASGVAIAAYAQAGGTVCILILALAFPAGTATIPALSWGAISGVGTGLGVAFLYRGLACGRMSVVVPVSDVGAAVLPILVGVAVLGERPSALAAIGIVVAVPAIWLISRSGQADAQPLPQQRPRIGSGIGAWTPARHTRTAAGATDGLLAGAGLALTWIALAKLPAGTGLWPLVISRVASVLVIVPLIIATRAPLRLPTRTVTLPAAAIGTVGTLGTLLYFLATRTQLLILAAVLSALYPAIPVLLALVFLRERITMAQTVGLTAAGAAIALIAFQ